MLMGHRIIGVLQAKAQRDNELNDVLTSCIQKANWQPPTWDHPVRNLDDFCCYLKELLVSTPVDAYFDDMFHGLYYIVSQNGNILQTAPEYRNFQEWLALFAESYGSYLNMPASANDLYDTIRDKAFAVRQYFQIPPGGFNNFNSFFSRHLKPGKRPIGTKTHPYKTPSADHPLEPNPEEDDAQVHQNMCDDRVITVPADSVYKGTWKIDGQSEVRVSKGNKYLIKDLLKGSRYADRFHGGIFTHSYLTVFTYHRYHVPVRGRVLESNVVMDQVYANVLKDKSGHLGATDETGYQFSQDRGWIILDSPVGLVAMVPIGMDFISSCNISVDVGDYVNKGDEFGYFLFGGSDMIMLFENPDIEIQLPKTDMLYKLGQVFAVKK